MKMRVPAHIVDSNAVAVKLMQQGDLARSLRLIRTTLVDLNQIVPNEEIVQSLQDGVIATTPAMGNDVIDCVSVSIDSQTLSNAHNGAFHFFNRALVLDSTRAAVGEASHVDIDQYKISAILLYNAGVCTHIKGIKSGASGDLATALLFYQNAFSLLTQTNAIQAVSDRYTLLVMALLNNMGYIKCQSCDHQACEICLDTMRRIFPSAEHARLQETDMLFFYLTTFLVPVEHLCASPAA